MKRINRLLSALLLISAVFSFVACAKKNRFEYCELGIVLNGDFEEYDSEGAFNVAYSDGNVIVGITRYSFVDCEEYGLLSTFTPLKLAEVYLGKMNRESDNGIEKHGDVPYFTYTEYSDDGSAYFYMPTFYRTPYAYFVITFITPKMREGEGRVEFYAYMSSVYILEEYL